MEAKLAAAKGKYIRKMDATSTMGPGVPIDHWQAESSYSRRSVAIKDRGFGMKKKAEKLKKSEQLKTELATVSTVSSQRFEGITVEQDNWPSPTVEVAARTLRGWSQEYGCGARRAGAPVEGLLKNPKGPIDRHTKTDPVASAKIITKGSKRCSASNSRWDG